MALYTVLYFGSHPDLDNDDCWQGFDFDSKDKAIEAYHVNPSDPSVRYIEIDGLEDSELESLKITRVRKNPLGKARMNDDEWKREAAMQAGMAFGCEGYNDYYG